MSDENIEVSLKSGSKLRITISELEVCDELFDSFCEELKKVSFTKDQDYIDLIKNVLTYSISSKRFKNAVKKCFDRCLYNDLKITKDTFEKVSSREDYIDVIFEVAKANLSPFMKGLFSQFGKVSELIEKLPG